MRPSRRLVGDSGSWHRVALGVCHQSDERAREAVALGLGLARPGHRLDLERRAGDDVEAVRVVEPCAGLEVAAIV